MENTVTIGEKDAGARGATAASGSGTGTRAQGRAGSRRRLGWVAIVPFFVIVALFEIMPLLQLALNSVIGRDSETLGLENYVRVFTTPLYQQSIWNSVWISLLSAVVGIVVAFLAARFAHEASPRVRNAFTMILNMMSNFSGVPLAFAFMILMGNAGVLTLIGQRFGIPLLANFDLYGADGLVIMYIYFQIPLATLLLIPAFAGIRKSWREAATILQASTFDYWFRIVIPNLMPSIRHPLGALLQRARGLRHRLRARDEQLCASRPANHLALQGRRPDRRGHRRRAGRGAHRAHGRVHAREQLLHAPRRQGKGARLMAEKNLRAAHAPAQKTSLAGKIFLGVVAAYLLVPFLATLVYSLFVEWTDILPSGFTLRNYQELFTNSVFWASIGRTLVLCLVSVAITIVLILLAMYVVVAVNRKVAPVMQFLCMIPYALQGVILSIGIISLYTGTGTILSNRMFMLFGAYTILVLPYIYQGIRNALNSIDAGMLIQAAEMLGCGRFRAYVQVVLPNILSGILVSSLLAESIIFGDFVLANNIAGTNYQNIQVFLQANMDVSSGLSSAIVVVIFVVVALVTALVLKLQGTAQNNAKEQA